MKIFKSLFLLLLLASMAQAQAQKPPFWEDIKAFKQQDSLSFPGINKILFVGSSSFTKWTDVQNYFPAYPIINRGFGGSSLTDVICYEKDIIFPYRPKQIFIYCGENDIAASETVTGKLVFERFKQLFSDIRNQFPEIPVAYISMKPSPSRWQMRNRMIEGNELIKKYLEQNKKVNDIFIDVWKSMLGPDGNPLEDIFIEDRLHMNAKGYAIWQKLIQPYLVKK